MSQFLTSAPSIPAPPFLGVRVASPLQASVPPVQRSPPGTWEPAAWRSSPQRFKPRSFEVS